MKTTCKQCKRKFSSLQDALTRECDQETCRLSHQEVMMPAKVKPNLLPDVTTPPFIPRPVKMRVMRIEEEVPSFYDPTEKCLFVKVPKAIVIKIYPKGKA